MKKPLVYFSIAATLWDSSRKDLEKMLESFQEKFECTWHDTSKKYNPELLMKAEILIVLPDFKTYLYKESPTASSGNWHITIGKGIYDEITKFKAKYTLEEFYQRSMCLDGIILSLRSTILNADTIGNMFPKSDAPHYSKYATLYIKSEFYSLGVNPPKGFNSFGMPFMERLNILDKFLLDIENSPSSPIENLPMPPVSDMFQWHQHIHYPLPRLLMMYRKKVLLN